MLWVIRGLLQGYRVVDSGRELTAAMAVQLAMDTNKRYSRGRSARVLIRNRTWAVMVKGWSPRKEDE